MDISAQKSLNQLSYKRSIRNGLLQVSLGCLALLLGVLVYLVDRTGAPANFIQDWMTELTDAGEFAGVLKGQLPDFLHIYAFILISASFISPTKKNLLRVCIAWISIECLLEIGQHSAFSQAVVSWIPEYFSHIPLLRNAQNYFLNGTFGWLDITGFFVGSLCAYFTVSFIKRRSRT